MTTAPRPAAAPALARAVRFAPASLAWCSPWLGAQVPGALAMRGGPLLTTFAWQPVQDIWEATHV